MKGQLMEGREEGRKERQGKGRVRDEMKRRGEKRKRKERKHTNCFYTYEKRSRPLKINKIQFKMPRRHHCSAVRLAKSNPLTTPSVSRAARKEADLH